jgi:hypothetical protein
VWRNRHHQRGATHAPNVLGRVVALCSRCVSVAQSFDQLEGVTRGPADVLAVRIGAEEVGHCPLVHSPHVPRCRKRPTLTELLARQPGFGESELDEVAQHTGTRALMHGFLVIVSDEMEEWLWSGDPSANLGFPQPDGTRCDADEFGSRGLRCPTTTRRHGDYPLPKSDLRQSGLPHGVSNTNYIQQLRFPHGTCSGNSRPGVEEPREVIDMRKRMPSPKRPTTRRTRTRTGANVTHSEAELCVRYRQIVVALPDTLILGGVLMETLLGALNGLPGVMLFDDGHEMMDLSNADRVEAIALGGVDCDELAEHQHPAARVFVSPYADLNGIVEKIHRAVAPILKGIGQPGASQSEMPLGDRRVLIEVHEVSQYVAKPNLDVVRGLAKLIPEEAHDRRQRR